MFIQFAVCGILQLLFELNWRGFAATRFNSSFTVTRNVTNCLESVLPIYWSTSDSHRSYPTPWQLFSFCLPILLLRSSKSKLASPSHWATYRWLDRRAMITHAPQTLSPFDFLQLTSSPSPIATMNVVQRPALRSWLVSRRWSRRTWMGLRKIWVQTWRSYCRFSVQRFRVSMPRRCSCRPLSMPSSV